MPPLRDVIQIEAWRVALEKCGAATGTTIGVYEAPDLPFLGPINSTPLFEAVRPGCDSPPMFGECVRRCLSHEDVPVVVESHGIAVIGVRLEMAGEAVGAVLAGYGLTAFPEEAAVRRFTERHGLALPPVWRAIRRQAPLTRPRLIMYADLLTALAETLIRENVRAQEYEYTAANLANAVQAKDRFLAMLAHELRNPLAPIRMAMQIISMRETSDPEVQKARGIVDRQVAHLTRLLDDLLDVSRITSGKIDLRKETVNLATAVANALEVSRSLIEERRHSLTVSLPEEEAVFVDADPVRLEQVITNLVNNAARYTPPTGHISVTVSREHSSAVLRVRDDGIGMPSDLVSKVFDLFAQADRSLARSEGGLGIGLTIVRNLVELHGGTVIVASGGPGQGSEFVVRLPLSRAAATPAQRPATMGIVVPTLRILVIEDNPDGRDMLKTMLEADGHRVYAAEDGPSGVEIALEVQPDIALIDIGLPGFDGYEVGRRIRGEHRNSIRLVALTGYGLAEDRRRSTDAGFDAHLVKPVAPEQLRDVLIERPYAGIRP